MERALRYDHYKVLGIPRDASPDMVKRAYRTLAKRCHPDLDRSPGAAQVFHAVQEAYETLIDADRRRRYDQRLLYYRTAASPTTTTRDAAYRRNTPHSAADSSGEEADRPVQRFAYVGLHVTGLLFGISLITSLVVGITFNYAPVWVLLFALPGVLAIPASIDGLRR